MTRDIWFISDTHFGHPAIISFGERPFLDVEEMDRELAERWAEHVKPQDLVYHLGDVAWTRAGLDLFATLPGTKRLILGNHDDGKACAPLVQRLVLYRDFPDDGFVVSHMPMFPERGRDSINVHGHLHRGQVGHPSYVNICVEYTRYRPLHIDEVRERVDAARTAVKALAAEEDLSG